MTDDSRVMTVHLIARFAVAAGCEPLVEQLLRSLTHAVRAEPGNIVFDAFRQPDEPGAYVVVEAYRDEPAFQAHLGSSHSRAFNRTLAELTDGRGSSLTFLTPLASDSGDAPAAPPRILARQRR